MINKSFVIYCKELAKTPLISKEEEASLYEEIKLNGRKVEEARKRLVESHLRFAFKIANDFKGLGVPLEDLVSEANIGLLMAVNRYKPDKGAKFSSYAFFWIKQRVCKALCEKSRLIRVPNGSMQKFLKILQFLEKYAGEFGEKPSTELLSKKFHMSVGRIKSIFLSTETPISINENVLDNEDFTDRELGECIKDEKTENASESLTEKDHRKIVYNALNQLSEKEKFVISRRFGLNNQDEQTLIQIGKKLNLTRERVRQIESEAIKKIRSILKNVKIEFAN
jgi:RNA polymerase primary sigma factor